jgi:hypothetical protein
MTPTRAEIVLALKRSLSGGAAKPAGKMDPLVWFAFAILIVGILAALAVAIFVPFPAAPDGGGGGGVGDGYLKKRNNRTKPASLMDRGMRQTTRGARFGTGSNAMPMPENPSRTQAQEAANNVFVGLNTPPSGNAFGLTSQQLQDKIIEGQNLGSSQTNLLFPGMNGPGGRFPIGSGKEWVEIIDEHCKQMAQYNEKVNRGESAPMMMMPLTGTSICGTQSFMGNDWVPQHLQQKPQGQQLGYHSGNLIPHVN